MAKKTQGLTAEEKAAMRETIRERKAPTGEADLLAKIEEMEPADRDLATRVHAIVSEVAPDLAPRTWYGMPAYAKDGKVLLFFQNAGKFKARYSTLGFQDTAALDDGPMWATSFAVTEITDEVAERIADLVRTAAG